MGLKLLKDADGTYRSTWYGRISVKGKKRVTNLGVPVKGTLPTDKLGRFSLSAKGDADFEKSRKAAQKAFDTWRRESQKDPAELQRKAHKARTGVDLEGMPLANLFNDWKRNVIRAKNPSPEWEKMVKEWFIRFEKFARAEARKHKKRCETVNDITAEIAAAWFEDIKGAYAWETVLKMKHLISGTFTRLQADGLARINPFARIQLRGGGDGDGKKISHKALADDELERVLDFARDTPLYPLVVTAACTGMRLGDVCALKWADIDMKAGLITCTTAKAGVRVTIPIFERLHEVLNDLSYVDTEGEPSPYVFPSAQAQYKRNKQWLIQEVKPIFAKAVFGKNDAPVQVLENGETTRELADVIGESSFTERKQARLMDVYARFKTGERSVDIAAALGVARSQISMDLRDIEKLTGETLRPMADKSARRKSRLDLIALTRQKRVVGKCSASLYGWHSFRHTFVVLALKAGVPVEDVRLVVGHGEAETTLNNYYNPENKHAAESLRAGMASTTIGRGTSRRRKLVAVNVTAPAPKPTVEDLVASLTEAERKALARKLLGL